MFTLIIKGFKDKSHLLDIANMLYNTKINVNELILEVIDIRTNDSSHKLGEWIIKGIDKTKTLYYDVIENGDTIQRHDMQ